MRFREERPKLVGPAAYRLVRDLDAALSQQLLGEGFFPVTVAEGKALVQPDRVRDDIRREAMAVEVARAIGHGCAPVEAAGGSERPDLRPRR
jgi:hypothetical protein